MSIVSCSNEWVMIISSFSTSMLIVPLLFHLYNGNANPQFTDISFLKQNKTQQHFWHMGQRYQTISSLYISNSFVAQRVCTQDVKVIKAKYHQHNNTRHVWKDFKTTNRKTQIKTLLIHSDHGRLEYPPPLHPPHTHTHIGTQTLKGAGSTFNTYMNRCGPSHSHSWAHIHIQSNTGTFIGTLHLLPLISTA